MNFVVGVLWIVRILQKIHTVFKSVELVKETATDYKPVPPKNLSPVVLELWQEQKPEMSYAEKN